MGLKPQESNYAAVVLAAGKGTRMKSELPKVAVPLQGKPMLLHVLENLVQSGVKRIVVVVGYKKEEVISLVPPYENVQIDFAHQEEQLGTAHAVLCAEEALKDFNGSVLVACGDMPLIRVETFQNLLNTHEASGNKATVLSAKLENPKGYGRLVRNKSGELIRIVEEKDADEETKKIQETNTGTYIFDAPEIFQILKNIGSENAQNEYYLPDAVEIFRSQGQNVGSLILDDAIEAMGANSKEDLEILEQKLKIGIH
jgi:UDP-N-acetylglucosamine pyrophosphorylase